MFSLRNPDMPATHANWWLYEDSRDLTETVWRELVVRHDRLKEACKDRGTPGGSEFDKGTRHFEHKKDKGTPVPQGALARSQNQLAETERQFRAQLGDLMLPSSTTADLAGWVLPTDLPPEVGWCVPAALNRSTRLRSDRFQELRAAFIQRSESLTFQTKKSGSDITVGLRWCFGEDRHHLMTRYLVGDHQKI
jgi:hypothetical protein